MFTNLKSNLITLICLCLLASAFAEEATRVESKSIQIEQDGILSIMSEDGEIQIEAWDRNVIQMDITFHAWAPTVRKAEQRLNAMNVEVIESQNRVVVREMDNQGSQNIGLFDILGGEFWKKKEWRGTQADYILKVPKKIRIKLDHDSGPISIQGTEGLIHVFSDEGWVEISQIRSDEIRIEVDEANVRLSDITQQSDGLCQIEMDEGNVHCTRIQMKSLEIQSDEGNISGVDIDVQQCRVEADGGHIDFNLYPQSDGRYSFYTDEGDIDLSLPQSASIQLRLLTGDGRIRTDTNLPIRRFDDGEQMEGRIGDSGNAQLKASSEEGIIRLLIHGDTDRVNP